MKRNREAREPAKRIFDWRPKTSMSRIDPSRLHRLRIPLAMGMGSRRLEAARIRL